MMAAEFKALHLGIGIQLVEIADAQGKIGVGKQLDCLRLGKSHEQRVDILLDGALLQKCGKGVRRLDEALICHIRCRQ